MFASAKTVTLVTIFADVKTLMSVRTKLTIVQRMHRKKLQLETEVLVVTKF